jgi:hypothetical protein
VTAQGELVVTSMVVTIQPIDVTIQPIDLEYRGPILLDRDLRDCIGCSLAIHAPGMYIYIYIYTCGGNLAPGRGGNLGPPCTAYSHGDHGLP